MTKALGRYVLYTRRKPSHYLPITGLRRGQHFIELWFRGNLIGAAK